MLTIVCFFVLHSMWAALYFLWYIPTWARYRAKICVLCWMMWCGAMHFVWCEMKNWLSHSCGSEIANRKTAKCHWYILWDYQTDHNFSSIAILVISASFTCKITMVLNAFFCSEWTMELYKHHFSIVTFRPLPVPPFRLEDSLFCCSMIILHIYCSFCVEMMWILNTKQETNKKKTDEKKAMRWHTTKEVVGDKNVRCNANRSFSSNWN